MKKLAAILMVLSSLLVNVPAAGATQQEWPEQVTAPYVDLMAYVRDKDYGVNGVPNLSKLSQESGIKAFNLGFILGRTTEDGTKTWSWGGYKGMNPMENDGWQFKGVETVLKEFRKKGGQYTISFGGVKSGQKQVWQQTESIQEIASIYKEVIDLYDLSRIDLDVEGEYMDYQENRRNAKAVKQVQEDTGVEVTLTVPVMNTGLIKSGQQVVQAYLEEGVDLSLVNIMTMCYGPSVSDYGQGSIEAMDTTAKQLQGIYKQYTNTTLSIEEAYQKLGTTSCIGSKTGHPFFTVEQFQQVVHHANQKKLGMVSFWAMNKDARINTDEEKLTKSYEYSEVAREFPKGLPEPETEVPTQPAGLTIQGITAHSAKAVWQAATDPTGVDTYEIVIQGKNLDKKVQVNELQVGWTELIPNTAYTVSVTAVDRSGNRSTPATTTFTTSTEETSDAKWQADKVYDKGDCVMDEGIEYEAHWWTKNKKPSTCDQWGVWRPTKPVAIPQNKEWQAGQAYVKGDKVTFEGKTYTAHWWTKNVKPTSCGQWGVWRVVE